MADEGHTAPAASDAKQASEPVREAVVATAADSTPPHTGSPTPARPSTVSRSRSSITVWLGVAVVLAWVVLELWGLGAVPFHTKGEPREALVVWEMTHGGGWILPKRNGTELPSKPPLFHWLGAITSLLRDSTDEWSIRFPSALLSLLGAVGVFAAGAALWTPAAGLVAALSLMTTFEWARAATSARVDMTLTVGLEAASLGFLFFLRTRRPLFLVVLYGGIAFAALGKGPVGIILPGAVALAAIIATRDFAVLRRLQLLRGAVAVLVIAGSWYVLALQIGGPDFFQKQVINENLLRFVGGPQFSGGHRHSNLALYGLLLLGMMPWTLFLPHVVAALWRHRRDLSVRGGELYCIAWIAVVCVLYAVATSKRSVYLLALYPAAALLLGWCWTTVAATDRPWRSVTLGIIGTVVTALVGIVLTVVLLQTADLPLLEAIATLPSPRDRANVIAVAQAIAVDPRLLLGCLTAAVAALSAFSIASASGHRLAALAALGATAAALIVAVRLVILPAVAERETLRDFMSETRQAVGPADAPFFYRTFDYGAVFYAQGHIPTYAGSFPAGAPHFLLMSRSEWERLRPRAVNDYEQVRLPSDPRRLVLVRRIATRTPHPEP